MLKQIYDAWRNNNGTMLFSFSVGIAVAVSVLWRFDMIPDIGPAMRSSPLVLGARSRPAPSIVVVSIASNDLLDAEVTMQIYSVPEIGNAAAAPIESHVKRLENGLIEFVITTLPRSSFAGLAYVDVNGNGQIDLDSEGRSAEPFGFVKSKQVDEQKPTPNGVFDVGTDPVFLKIELQNPSQAANKIRAESGDN